MRGMDRTATAYPTGSRVTRGTDEQRAQARAAARIAGRTMSAAAGALLRAVGEAAAMALVCAPRQDGR